MMPEARFAVSWTRSMSNPSSQRSFWICSGAWYWTSRIACVCGAITSFSGRSWRGAARPNDWHISLTLNSACRLASLEAAKKKARAEKKLLGFIMVWDMMFRPARPMGTRGPNSLAGFYTVFNNALVLVFVRHEDELDKVPDAVKQGFFGPEEGGWAPNMAVVTADCSQYVCEIPMGGEHSTGGVREPIFRAKIAVIKKFLENPEAFAPKPAQHTNTESATVEPAKTETNDGDIIPGQRFESIRKIPQQTRRLYGGIAIGVLVLVFILVRLARRKGWIGWI